MATGRVRPLPLPDGWIPGTQADAGLFTIGVDVVADSNQGVSGIWWYQPPAPGTVTNVTLGLYVQATQTLVAGTSVTLLAGSIVADAWNLATFGATAIMTGGTTYTIVATMSGEHGYDDPAGYPIDDPTNTVHLPGPGRFQAGAGPYPASDTWTGQHGLDIEMVEAIISGTLTLELPLVEVALDADAVASAALTLTLPAPDVELDADADVSAVLSLSIPTPDVELDADVDVTGTLTLEIPTPVVDLNAVTPSTGGGSVPCGWVVPDPLCCPSWDELDPAIQDAARDYAATVLWAATGRRYGLCTVTVRPCGMKRCQDGGAEFFGYDWSGGTWIPYIFNGVWFNCACATFCCCDPRCQVRLMGPVESITEITIGGVVVDPGTYRVDDEHWLVRTNGDCWPQCSDMNTDDGANVFIVTYVRGEAVPTALLTAASMLACEWAKACTGGDCRLSNRVTSLARNGVQIDMIDPNEFLQNGLTGLSEVDSLILAYNPYGLKQRLRVYAPELRVPRTVTWP